MAELDDLVPDVLTFAPRCSEPVIYRFLREVATEFCERGRMWRCSDEFQVKTPDCEAICAIGEAVIFEIERARLDGNDLTPATPEWLDKHMPDWDTAEAGSGARWITQLAENRLTIAPKQSGLLKLRLLLKPSRDCETLPDFLVAQHGSILSKAAASKILLLPTTDYANPQLAGVLWKEFDSRLDDISIKGAKGQQNARLRASGSYF